MGFQNLHCFLISKKDGENNSSFPPLTLLQSPRFLMWSCGSHHRPLLGPTSRPLVLRERALLSQRSRLNLSEDGAERFPAFLLCYGWLNNQHSLIIIHTELFISCFSFQQGKQVEAGHFLVDCEKIDRSISLTCGSDVERKESKGNILVAF